jgi:hypothetical protein
MKTQKFIDKLWLHANDGSELARFIKHCEYFKVLQQFLPEVAVLKNFPHNIETHPEGPNVFDHVLAALRTSDSSASCTNIALMLHDIGKARTYKLKGDKHTYYGHADCGRDMMHDICVRLFLSDIEMERMLSYVAEQHMNMHWIEKMRPNKVGMMVHNKNWPVLKYVSRADDLCRGASLADPKAFDEKINRVEQMAKESDR